MKAMLNKILLFGILALSILSCKKDEDMTIIQPGASPALTATANTIVLEQDKATEEAVTFSWPAVEFGYDAAVTYSLQISKKGTEFSSATTTEVVLPFTNNTTKSRTFTVGDLNKELLKVLQPGAATDVEVRVKAEVGATAPAVFSNILSVKVTPYKDLIIYSYPQALNVAGNFQGWAPDVAPQLVALTAVGGKYEEFSGFIDFGDTQTPEFKIVKGASWDGGDYGSPAPGKIGNGGDNIKLPSGGIYLLNVNTTAMTLTSTKINSWGLIGDGIPGTGWDSDKDLTYDPATKTWRITLDLQAGAIKFRANDGWDINFGDNGNDGKPEPGGENIPVTDAGNYTIVFDVGVAGNYGYSLKRN